MKQQYYNGIEILKMDDNIQNDEFATEENIFELISIDKHLLYDVVCCDGYSRNLKTYKEWSDYADNEDEWHTNKINWMVEFIKNGGKLPPLIVNKELGLYDGQHRLTAYSMLDEIKDIKVFKQI